MFLDGPNNSGHDGRDARPSGLWPLGPASVPMVSLCRSASPVPPLAPFIRTGHAAPAVRGTIMRPYLALAATALLSALCSPAAAQTCTAYCPDGTVIQKDCDADAICPSDGPRISRPQPPPDPRVIALGRASARFMSLVQKWGNDLEQ